MEPGTKNISNGLQLKDLVFPVFVIQDPIRREGDRVVCSEGGNIDKVVDDKGIRGDTLGLRRLRMSDKVKYPLKKGILTIAELLRTTVGKYSTIALIDSNGTVFKWARKDFVKLSSHQIKTIVDDYTILCHGVPFVVKVPFLPKDEKWVSLLKIGKGYLFYNYSMEEEKATRKKV